MQGRKFLCLLLGLILPLAVFAGCGGQSEPQEETVCLDLNCTGECGSKQCMERYMEYGRTYIGKTLWTIGDSIFDFNDNSYNEMVPSIAANLGFTSLYMDNIAGSTSAAASGVGIADHIDAGTYAQWKTPDVILIQRGTNDAYFWNIGNIPKGSADQTDKTAGLGSVRYVCEKLRAAYPDALIVWSTPIWRADTPESELEEFCAALKSVCPAFDVNVFNLRDACGITATNYTQYLYDGIHPNADGAARLRDAYIEYFRFGIDG